MQFLTNGDFGFPWAWSLFFEKLFYIWSFQSGAPNPDGIIRMPARIVYLLVFGLFGNLTYEYFYIFSTLLILFASFYIFSVHFLRIQNMYVKIVSSLIFTINPIFLGNISKLGLVLAVAMLPLCLVAIKKAIEKNQPNYLLLLAILLNISLLHPYNFAVNFAVSIAYLGFKLKGNTGFVTSNIKKIVILGILVIGLNAYFIMPIASMGTVSKDVLSSDSSTPTDYSTLIDVANTGDILTGLSLSKGAFKDYDFYNDSYQALYFLGSSLFYVVILGAYLVNQKKIKLKYKVIFTVASLAFLVLILLATVEFLSIGEVLKKVVNLPGGWIFRSPLKWQLYMPVAFATLLIIALASLNKKSHLRVALSILGLSFVLMNSYVGYQVFEKLLTPRKVEAFQGLSGLNLDHKNIAYINSVDCRDFATQNPKLISELSQVFISKNVQVKQYTLDKSKQINLDNFDYVLSCQSVLSKDEMAKLGFSYKDSYESNAFQLFSNDKAHDFAYVEKAVSIAKNATTAGKYIALSQQYETPIDFVYKEQVNRTPISVQDPFEELTFDNLQTGKIKSTVEISKDTVSKIIAADSARSINYKVANDGLLLSLEPRNEFQTQRKQTSPIPTMANSHIDVTLEAPTYDFKNVVPNPSFEQKSWQEKVGSCFSSGANSEVGMEMTSDSSDGAHGLKLSAKQQIACVSSGEISVKPDTNYLLDLDYKSLGGNFAGYDISFGGTSENRINKRLDKTVSGKWAESALVFETPEDSKDLRITLYAYGASDGTKGVASYDNIRLTSVPKIQDQYYFVSESKKTELPRSVSVIHNSITDKGIQISGAKSGFFLTTKETFNAKWALNSGSTTRGIVHYRNVSNLNSWYIDPTNLCKTSGNSCRLNGDGSYDINLKMEFIPQKWFAVGVVVSLATLMSIVGYTVMVKLKKNKTSYVVKR